MESKLDIFGKYRNKNKMYTLAATLMQKLFGVAEPGPREDSQFVSLASTSIFFLYLPYLFPLRNWLMLMHPIYGILLEIVCCKLVMKYVERKKVEKTMGIHGGGMKREGSNTTKKVAYKKMCKNRSDETKLDITISKIEQRKWLLIL